MSEPLEPSEEIVEWLTTLHLPQYALCFQLGGYRALEDCKDLTDERLLELRVFPTGHRRRILRGLEALGLVGEDGEEDEEEEVGKGEQRGTRKPVTYPRHVFLKDRNRGTSFPQPQPRETRESGVDGTQSLPPGAGLAAVVTDAISSDPPQPAPRDPRNIRSHSSASLSTGSSSSDSLSVSPRSEVPSDWDMSSEDPSFSSTDSAPCPAAGVSLVPSSSADPGVFQGEMVENSIYEGGTSFKAPKGQPRPTRSYRLRHRPVPEIPKQVTLPPQDWSAPPVALTTSPERQPSSQGPPGANDDIQKAPLQRKMTPIHPYGETFLYNPPENILDQGPEELLEKESQGKIKHKKLRKKQLKAKESAEGTDEPEETVPAPASALPDHGEDDYSTVEECAASLQLASRGAAKTDNAGTEPLAALQGESVKMVECDLYSLPEDALGTLVTRAAAPVSSDISPYACFYGGPKTQQVKAGWLDKLSPQGKRVFQRRWVRFDGESLSYYNNDKEMYSKGMILAGVIRQVRGLGDNKFEVVTSHRTFIFRAEREGERQEWMEALQTASRRLPTTRCSHKPSSSSNVSPLASANKRGALELRGYKGRVLVSLAGSRVRLCKTEQDYKAGLAITEVELTAAHIKGVDRRGFEISTPFKNFCFTAESEREREQWIEAVQESIAETLSDYEVAEKIWFNEANRICADCHAPRPEWASVNLVVVICKKCAGQHRSLGSSISKVRSLKLDISVWSNELVELFLEVGNQKANSFWACALPLEEELHMGASAEKRATFLRRKYRERKYCRVPEDCHHQEALNQALCSAVVTCDVLRSMALVFSGADVMCATGDPEFSTPYLLAQRAGQRLQMEFLHHNKLSDFPKLEPENSSPSDARPFMDGFLYISPGLSKATLERRGRDEMVRRWCTLEGGFLSYYESERSPTASGRVDVSEVVSLAVSNTETMTGAGAVFTLELYLLTERVLLVGAQTQETQHDWLHALAKCFVPCTAEATLRRDSELIGRLHYKEGHDLYHWRVGWFSLGGSSRLRFSSGEGEGAEQGELRLKQLQELTVSTHTEGEDKIQVLLMVEGGRTVYIHGFNKLDFALWHSAITLAAGTDGNALGNQQLNKNGVPIILDSCMAFVTQYGLCQQGVYERQGEPGRVALLLEEFGRDARNVKLRHKEHRLEDVTDTLKTFLSQAEDALLTKELYPYWVAALDEKDERQRVKKYSAFIQSLPKTNRSTLEALLQHLYRIQQCSHLNQMAGRRLASVFSSCLFQTRGQTPLEVTVVHDLIANYVALFHVNEDQVQQMERENRFIVGWNDKKDTTFSPAGDLIFEVYLEKRQPENCCLIKLSPSMRSNELAESALSIRNIAINADNLWTTFEVIENGELERPLHHKENILEQVLEWSSLDDPGSAFLVIKTFERTKMVAGDKDRMQFMKGDHLKFKDGSSKLLSGHKFQDKYVVLRADKLLLYRDYKSTKPEREVPLMSVKCYLGLRKKLKPPNSWGFTVYTDKHQWHFCCEGKEAQLSWVTDIIRMKYGSDLWLKSSGSGEPGARGASRRASVHVGQGGPQALKHNAIKQPTDRTVSLGVAKPRSDKDAGVDRYKTGAATDGPSAKEAVHRRASLGVCLPHRCPSPSARPSALALPPVARRTASKSPNRSSVLGEMPPNVLNELKSVLSRAGQGTKDNV